MQTCCYWAVHSRSRGRVAWWVLPVRCLRWWIRWWADFPPGREGCFVYALHGVWVEGVRSGSRRKKVEIEIGARDWEWGIGDGEWEMGTPVIGKPNTRCLLSFFSISLWFGVACFASSFLRRRLNSKAWRTVWNAKVMMFGRCVLEGWSLSGEGSIKEFCN